MGIIKLIKRLEEESKRKELGQETSNNKLTGVLCVCLMFQCNYSNTGSI